MKVLIITNFYPYKNNSSRGIFVSSRLREYKKFDCHPKIVGISYHESIFLKIIKKITNKKPLIPATELENLKYEYITLRRGLGSIFFHKIVFAPWIQKLIILVTNKFVEQLNKNKEKFELIHAHGMYLPVPAGIIAWKLSKLLNIPYVITAHGSDINYQMNHRSLRKIYINALEEASKVIFVSEKLLQKAKFYGYSGKNAIVIPNGFDPNIFFPRYKSEVRQELGLFNEKVKYVGYVGGLKYVKRADKLPEIFYQIAKKIPDVKFIVVGDGELRTKIQRKVKKLNLDVLFTGNLFQGQVAKYMSAMDVMVLPSRNEGFPDVCIEAQACGTCVVGSNNGGLPEAIGFKEFVVDDGEGFEKRFAQRVVEVLINGYDGNLLIERSKDFTWTNIVKKEIEVYKDIILNT